MRLPKILVLTCAPEAFWISSIVSCSWLMSSADALLLICATSLRREGLQGMTRRSF